REVYNFMASRMSDQIKFRSRTLSFDKHTHCSTDVLAIEFFLNGLVNTFKLAESDRLLLFGAAIGETRSRSSCAFGVLKDVQTIVARLLNQLDRLSKVFLSFTGEAHDDVAGQRQASR